MSNNRDFIKSWILLIGVGLLIGYELPMRLIPANEIMNLASKFQTSSFFYNLIVGILGFGGSGLFVGLSVGIAQIIVLRKYLSISPLWIILTMVGYFFGFSIVGSLTLSSMEYLNQFTMSVFGLPSGASTLAVYVVFVNAIGILPTLVGLIAINSVFGFIVGSCVGLAHSTLFPRGILLVKYIWGFMVGATSTSFVLTLLGVIVDIISNDMTFPKTAIYHLVGLMAGLITWSMIGNDLLAGLSKGKDEASQPGGKSLLGS